MSFKFAVELCVMTMKNDTKLEEELSSQNLTRALENYKKIFFGSL